MLRLSDALRLECRPLGIQVLLVAPGFIDTKARVTAKVGTRGLLLAARVGGGRFAAAGQRHGSRMHLGQGGKLRTSEER